jgi:RNA polymerase sigma-70 factor (ECF subfamily)
MNDRRAQFWKLVEPEHRKMQAFCRRLANNRDEGDDLCQDTLVRALRGFDSLKNEEAFRPWLYRIAINRFKSRCQRGWWSRMLPLTREIAETAAGSDPIAVHNARRRLEIAFRALTPEEKALVTLFEIDGWPLAELARMTGKTVGSIKMRLSRSRKKMRRALSRFLSESPRSELKKNINR